MKNLKRYLALVLAMCMMLTAVPFGAFAAESTDQTDDPTASVTAAPDSDVEAMADDGIATASVTLGTKPADGTVTGEPFNTAVSKNYRIPGLVNHNGTLIASADARWDYEKDGGGMDLVVSRSTDGDTWNYTFAGYLGDNGNKWDAYSSTLMDPVIISDGSTLYLLADMFPAGYSISGGNTANNASLGSSTAYTLSDTAIGFDGNGNLLLSSDDRANYDHYLKDGKVLTAAGAETGYTVQGWYDLYQNGTYVTNLFFADSPFQLRATSYICMSTSTDGGVTWSDPTLLNVKPSGVAWMVLGPGSGVATKDGKLAFTAYDDSSIYLITGKDGQWDRVRTNAATNESSIIELNDGTIRAFVKRAGSNTIAYVDFTKTSSGYTAGSLVDTDVVNFSQCMVSSLHYSKTLNGKEVVLVCCPSKPGAGDWNGRFNGKIHMFTLDGSNNMTLVKNSYALNGESDFFAYSNMAEMNDGTIAVLYEDDCISYNAGNYSGQASHISYKNVNLETAFNVKFDDESDNEEQPTGEIITMYVGESQEIVLNENVGSGNHSSTAADVVWTGTTTTEYYLQAQTGTTYAFNGEKINLDNCLYTFNKVSEGGDGATTWVISRELDEDTKLYVHVHDGSTSIPNRTNSTNVVISPTTSAYNHTTDGPFIFTGNGSARSLHFHTNGNSYYWNQCSSAHAENDSNGTHGIFILKINGTELTEVTSTADLQSGEEYLIAGMGTNGNYYVMHPSTDTSNKYSHVAKVLSEQGSQTASSTSITITGKAVGTTTVDIGGTTYTISVKSDAKEITLDVGESYTDTIDGSAYTKENASVADESIATIDKVESTTVAGETEYSLSANVTSIESGKTYVFYNKVAQKLMNNQWADASVGGGGSDGLALSSTKANFQDNDFWTVTVVDGGYYIKDKDGKYLTVARGKAGVSETAVVASLTYDGTDWTIGENGEYLNDYGGAHSAVAGWSDINDNNSQWEIYEVIATTTGGSASTEVTFTGVKIGTTTAQVGHVKYTITVEGDTRDLALKIGETKTDTINGVGYTIDDVTTWPEDSIAKLNSVTSTGAQLVPVTQIESGKHYLIVNAQTGDVLTNAAVSATGDWDNKPGLDTTGKPATDSTELWAITASGNGYTIVQDNQYLTASGFYAVMSDTETALTLNYTESGWTIMDNTTCLSLTDHDNKDYYLSDNVGNGYDEAAMGTGDMSNYCYWNIYEIDAAGSTNVSFTGVATGETKAVIGGVTYNITVAEDIREITLHKGQSQTFYIDGSHYTTGTIKDSSIATLDSVVPGDAKLVLVSEIVSGEQYLIVNSQTGEVLTDTAITLTGDAGEKSALVTEGTASVDNTELWTITGDAINGYTVSQDGKYLTVAGYHAAMGTTATNLKLTKSNSGWMICDKTTWSTLGHNQADYYLRNGIADANYTTDAMGSSITSSYSYWDIYKIDTTPVTEVTFTGVQEGNTTATVGHVTFNITVDNVTEGDIADFNNIVGVDSYTDGNSNATNRSDLDMAGKKITSLRITEGASFHLGVDVTGYDSVNWSVADTDIATVDADGNVTAVKAGETVVTATVIKNGIMESISIPVTVVPSMVEGYTSSQISPIFYYIEEIETTDPYYTMFLSTENTTGPVDGHKFIMVSEGEVIWYERPTDSAFGWVWTADPWEGTALTYMASTGSVAEYYPLKTPDDDGDTLGSGTSSDGVQYYKGNNGYNNIVKVGNDDGASWQTALDALLGEAIVIGKNVWPNYGCDGAMSNTRWDHDGVPTLVTSMTFISDPMPQIDKSVNGILPVTRLQKDFRRYEDGMVATVGEYVYFDITITVERPDAWVKDSSGNDTNTGAITYSNALLTDYALNGAYFYTKELDMADSADGKTLDGIIAEEYQVQIQDITNALNADWAEDETVRTLNYYLIYVIVEDDIPKFSITNTANLAWNYQSVYSDGKLSGAADAQASITVVGSAMENVVIDFGQSFEYTGLTAEHLKYVHTGTYNTNYGVVEVIGIGDEKENSSGKYYDNYKVIYTPTSILRGPDAVQLMGSYIDQDDTNTIPNDTKIEKAINGFVVYPATSVYYEEGFMFNYQNDDATSNTQWVTTNSQKATVYQTFEKLNKKALVNQAVTYVSDKQHPYGYDPIYDGVGSDDVAASAVSSAVVGAATSFTFTGTGFELYANSTTGTGRVAVSVYNAAGTLETMYVVNTVAANGATGATEGQNVSLNTLPIVSVKDLAHGTYTVKLTKVVNDSKPVNIDGVRIINTVDESKYVNTDKTSASPFIIDLEDNPNFYQLRDYVLYAVNVDDVKDSMYAQLGEEPSISQIADQIYANVTSDDTAPAAVITADSDSYNGVDVQDLLDNGPKNELYLHQGETLTFKVSTNRMMQIGLKAPQGSATYTLKYKVGSNAEVTVADAAALNTSVDMFYELYKFENKLTTAAEYTITVTNNGSNILSVTDLKICDDPNATFVPLTAEDIESALVTMNADLAENTTTGISYATVSEALSAAQAGETVKLLADCTESTVMVTPGVTLDLNGCKLTASYAVAMNSAHIVDNVGTGSVVIGMNALVLDEGNAMIPVYNGEGYVFTKAGFAVRQDTNYTGDGFKIQAMAYPVQMAVVDLLKDGGADNNIEIVIRLSWDTDQGTGSQDFKFTDEVVASVYSSNNGSWSSYSKMFSMVVSGFESIENLKANIIVVSGTDAEYAGSKPLSIT